MSLKKFQFYLTTEDGRSYYVQNGVVTSRGIPSPLPQSPDGWQDIAFAWERNKTRHGTQRAFSYELGFVLDGAEIIRDAYYKRNLDGKIYLLIQQLVLEYGTAYKWKYQTIYKGELDMTTVRDYQTGNKVTVSIMEGDLHKQINANWSTVYRIEFDADAVNVKMDGISLQEAAKYTVPDEVTIQKTVYGTDFFLPATFINREGNLPYLAFTSQALQVAPAVFADKLTDPNYLVKAADNNTGQTTVRITGRLKFTCTDNDPNNGFKVRFLRSGQTTVNQDDYLIFTVTPDQNESYDYDVDETIPLAPGERLYLEGIYFGTTGTEVAVQFNPASDLKLTYEKRGPQTWVKGFLRKHLFRKLMKKITGSEEQAISELLEEGDRVITSFDAIRGIEGAGIQTTLADFYTDTDADLCAGLGIVNGAATANLPPGHRATLEARESFYNSSDPADLGEAKELEVGTPAEILISKIKVGWKEPQTEDVNGKFGFNASQQYTTPMQRTNNEYLAVSPYKADPFEIETVRIALNGKDSTDSQKDNDNAVLWVERSQNDLTASVSFFSTGNKVRAEDTIEFVVGQKIRFTGSASNDGETFITAVDLVPSLNLQILTLDKTLIDEGPVSVLIEWVEGITYDLKREAYDNENDPDGFGVPSPTTVFNIDLSPKRMLLRHGRWLASILEKYRNEKLIFQSGTRNTNLKTVQGSVTVSENANVNINDLGEALFQPYLLFATVNGDNNLFDQMESNPNRCFSCTLSGKTLKGFNMKAAYAPNELNEQVFSLLCTYDTDIKKLV